MGLSRLVLQLSEVPEFCHRLCPGVLLVLPFGCVCPKLTLLCPKLTLWSGWVWAQDLSKSVSWICQLGGSIPSPGFSLHGIQLVSALGAAAGYSL